MEEKLMRFWINTVGRVQEERGYYVGKRCPLCNDGGGNFEINNKGGWLCLDCGQEGSLRDLIYKMHKPEVAEKVIKKYGLEKLVKAVKKNG